MNTCKNCRWWSNRVWKIKKPAHEMMECGYYISHNGKEDSAIIVASGPDFSCIHYEKRN